MCFGQIAFGLAWTNGHRHVLSGATCPVETPIACIEETISSQIDRVPAALVTQTLWDLIRGQSAVAIFVSFLQDILKWRQILSFSSVGSRSPARDVDRFAADDGSGFHLPGQAAHPPQALACRGRVSRELIRSGNND